MQDGGGGAGPGGLAEGAAAEAAAPGASVGELCTFVDRALEGMIAVVESLGDELASTAPAAGVNSPYALLTHSLGVVGYWVGYVIGGRPVERDREAELTASGPVDELAARARAVLRGYRSDLAAFDPRAPLRGEPPGAWQTTEPGLTCGGALVHVLEEVAQHHGHAEITRDWLLARHRPAAG